ncbi:peptidase M20, partial [Pseudomonas sp. HMWF010]
MSRRFAGSVLALSLTFGAAPTLAAAQDLSVSPQRLSDITRDLSSEAFAGRAPGGPGEGLTVDYLVSRFKALGLEPSGDDGSWTQTVPLVRLKPEGPVTLGLATAGGSLAVKQAQEIQISTLRPVDRVTFRDAPLVFVGYGVTAPERGWDDFKGVDLKGKIAVILISDPDFEAGPDEPVAGKFAGKAATYYARWTYKYEEAVRRGALGALIVHEAPGAGYGWSTVIAPAGEGYDIVRDDPAREKLLVQGWIQRDAAAELFRRSGQDFEALKLAARRADFRPVPLAGASLSADFAVRHERMDSRNILARLPGTSHPDETILYAAHWDAFGIGAPDAQG